jgi:hypothetical protein
VTTQDQVARTPLISNSLLHRSWPVAGLFIAVVVNLAWMGFSDTGSSDCLKQPFSSRRLLASKPESNVHDDAIGLPNSRFADLAALMTDSHASGTNIVTHDGHDDAALDHLAQSLAHASNIHLV